MADELDPVTEVFTADTAEYEAHLQEAAATAQEFAAANEEAQTSLDGLRDSSAEAGVALGGLRDDATEAAAANEAAGLSAGELRDRLAEVAAAAGIYTDEAGRMRDAQGRFVAQSTLMDLALGHERDEALEAAAAFKELRDAKVESDVAGGGGGGGLSSLLGKIPMGSGLTSLPAMLAIVPAVEALLPEVAGLVAGFAAAGAGAGAFALLAAPAFKSVSGAYQQISADQKAYDRALTATAKNNALKHLQQDYANLDPAQRGAVQGIQQLVGEYHKLSTAFEPQAFKIFDDVLKIANELLPQVTPFATTFADALDGLLQKVAKFTGSTGFKDWLKQFQALEGPSITAIGDGLGKVAVSAGKLLTVMSSKDVVNAINIAFTILNGTIQLVTYMIKRLMDNWDGMSVAVRHSWYDIKQWTDDVTRVFGTLRHASAEFGHDWATAFDTVRHAVASWAHDVASAFDTARHGIATAGHDIASTFDTVRHAAATLGHDVAAAFDDARHTIASWADWLPHEIATGWDNARHLTAQALDNIRHDIATGFDNVRHDIAAFIDWLPHEIAVGWDNARHDTASGLDNIRHDIASRFDQVRHDIAAWVDDVVNWFKQLPGKILAVLARIPGDMLNVGRNIVHGLINGVESMAGTLLSAIEDLIPSPIRSVVSSVLGIFSPSTVFHGYGVNIVQGLINGVASMQPHLRSAMQALSGNVTAPGSALAAGAVGPAGGTSVHVQVPMTLQGTAQLYNTPQFTQYIQGVVQEGVLRYGQLNPHNGLSTAWGRG